MRYSREDRELPTIDIKGKQAVKYVDLLNLAHNVGLVRLESRVVHFSLDPKYAVAEATAEFEDGTVFHAIGDAAPENVGTSIIALHFVRMADTRAKARVLRDALNVDANAIEEFDESGPAPSASRAPRSTAPRPSADGDIPATANQLKYLASLARTAGVDVPEGLTKDAASSMIQELQAS